MPRIVRRWNLSSGRTRENLALRSCARDANTAARAQKIKALALSHPVRGMERSQKRRLEPVLPTRKPGTPARQA